MERNEIILRLGDDLEQEMAAKYLYSLSNSFSNNILFTHNLHKENHQVSYSWKGLSFKDRKRRITKIYTNWLLAPKYYSFKRGKLLGSFNKSQLIKIAWEIGIDKDKNPNFTNFERYSRLWRFYSKETIANKIWNYLRLTNNIIYINYMPRR